VSREPSGPQQQSREPGEDDDPRLCDRRARDALRLEPDLVRRAERAGDDERAADLLLLPGGPGRLAHDRLGAQDARPRVRHVSALPVLLPAAERLALAAKRERATGVAPFRLEASH